MTNVATVAPRANETTHSTFDIRHSTFWRDLWLLAILVILGHAPFLWRPFHIDDRIYLEISRQAARTPLYPHDYRAVFEGKHGPDAASHSHPPLISYLLALLRSVRGGEDEFFFHVVFLIFPIVLAIGVYLLVVDQIKFPLLVALLVVWNPAIYVLSQSVMTDVPFVALYTFALALFFFGERFQRDLRWPAAAVLAAAAMTNYLALSAIPLLLAVQWWRRKPLSRLLPLVLLPLLVCAAWVLLQSIHYQRFILATTGVFLATEGNSHWFFLGRKLLSAVLNLGSMLLVPCLFQLNRLRSILGWLVLALTAAAYTGFRTEWHWLHCLLLGIFLASGVYLVGAAFTKSRGTTNRVSSDIAPMLRLWLFGFLAACVLIFYHGSVRYVLPMLVPGVIVTVAGTNWSRRKASACVLATLGYAVVLGHADYQLASIYPRISEQVVHQYSGKRLWTTGEWGFRYYMESNGAQTLVREDQRPDTGDILIKPGLAMPYITAYDNDEYLDLLRREFVYVSNPIRLLNFDSHAGFYSTGWGILPWSVETERRPVEIFNFFQVKKRFQGDPSRLREDYFR